MHRTFIVSDLHLGLKQFERKLFLEFLEHLPPESTLILNGDTIDIPGEPLCDEDIQILNKLAQLSQQKNTRVIWLEGNHDDGYRPENAGDIEFESFYVISSSEALVTHGASFDNIMPYNQWFLWLFKHFHRMRVKMGRPPVHVAEYAKKWKLFYEFLKKNVRANAIEHARENGWSKVVCGHLHCAEVYDDDGICYVNTGTWTEFPPHFAVLDDNNGYGLYEYRGGYIPDGGKTEA